MISKKIGKVGEKIAEEYLKKKGYEILDRNYVFKIPGDLQRGEIDIVTKKGKTICFVEVKTLNEPKFNITPEAKINFSKKKRIIATAESWLIKKKIPLDYPWQIDVVSVVLEKGEKKIFHFENAISQL